MKIDMSNRDDFDYKEYFDNLSRDLKGKVDEGAYDYFCDYRSYDGLSKHSLHDAWIQHVDMDYDTGLVKITYLTAYQGLVAISYDCRDQRLTEFHFRPYGRAGSGDIVFHRVVVGDEAMRHELLYPDNCLTTIYFQQVQVEILE